MPIRQGSSACCGSRRLEGSGIKNYTGTISNGAEAAAGADDSKAQGLKIILGPSQMVQKLLTDEDHGWITAHDGLESTHVMKLGYDDFTRRDVLRAILPLEMEVACSFEEAGHIAHYNLRKEHSPYKEIIGQVTLDKSKKIRTVVNKVEELGSSSFRFFKMELLAGEDDYITSLQENHCSFTMDYSKVYWNSRLMNEHRELVDLFKKDEVVLDVFAGVGPFAVPAAKNKHCFVHANDLNPHSYTYLVKNIKNNGVSGRVKSYNLDGREFIRSASKQLIQQSMPSILEGKSVTPYSHVIMNLPGTATQFLDTFRGIFSEIPAALQQQVTLPQIHCYCFADHEDNHENSKMDPIENVVTHLGVERLEEGHYSVHKVRSVSPMTVMMRVTFRLPYDVAYLDCKDDASKDIDKLAEGNSKKAVEGFTVEENIANAGDTCVDNKPAPRVDRNEGMVDLEEPEPKRCKAENI